MQTVLKNIYIFITKLLQTITALVNIFLFSRFFIKPKKIVSPNRSISILANGPSAKYVMENRYELLCKSDVLCMNYTGNSPIYTQLKPKYYILLDPLFFVSEMTDDVKQSDDEHKNRIKKLLKNIMETSWEMVLFLPADKKVNELANRFAKHKFVKVLRYNATKIDGFDRFQFWAYKHNLGIPSSRNVIIPAILQMINCGYQNIYLYGAEFSWTRTLDVDTRTGKLYINDRHFYKDEDIIYYDRGGFKMWMDSISSMLYGVDQMAKYAEKKGVQIINRTKGSFIDSFRYECIDNIE